MAKLILTDGARVSKMNMKSSFGIDPWQDETPGVWVPDKSSSRLAKDSRLVPSMFAGVFARAQAMADMPFSIYRLDGTHEKVDDSAEYQNVLGFLPFPSSFFWMTESSLITSGRCYYFISKGTITGGIKGLKYWQWDTITPKFDRNVGLVSYKRSVDNRDYAPEEVLEFWLPDPTVEIGPPEVYPFASALTAAQANGSITEWTRDYMKRGAVKAMLLAVDGLPDQQERERIEDWFNRFMAGAKGLAWKLFNASSVKPTIVGDGLDALKGLTINSELRYEIHTALGTRHLLEDENYATANARERQFINLTMMPEARFIQQRMNKLIEPMGVRLDFEPERLQSFSDIKAERAQALAQLYNVLAVNLNDDVALELALDFLGYDFSEAQKALFKRGLKTNETSTPETPTTPTAPAENEPTLPKSEKSRAIVELDKWEQKVLRSGKMITWHAVDIPEPISKQVKEGNMSFEQARSQLKDVGGVTGLELLEGMARNVEALKLSRSMAS